MHDGKKEVLIREVIPTHPDLTRHPLNVGKRRKTSENVGKCGRKMSVMSV